MIAATKSITQCRGVFVYSIGTFLEVYLKDRNKSVKAVGMLHELCEDVGIPKKLNSDIEPEFCGQESSFIKFSKGKQINITYADPEHSN